MQRCKSAYGLCKGGKVGDRGGITEKTIKGKGVGVGVGDMKLRFRSRPRVAGSGRGG